MGDRIVDVAPRQDEVPMIEGDVVQAMSVLRAQGKGFKHIALVVGDQDREIGHSEILSAALSIGTSFSSLPSRERGRERGGTPRRRSESTLSPAPLPSRERGMHQASVSQPSNNDTTRFARFA